MNRIFIFSFIFFSGFLFAEKNPKDSLTKTPRVGLVLSGGGARGYAHIGVLKVLDSLGVRIDYIVGTSMGAIVGGLYACGYTGLQLDSIAREMDLVTLINNPVLRRSKPFFAKKEKYIFALALKNFQISLPKGVSTGQKVIQKLEELTIHVHDIHEFSNLPIPFLAISTNLETGEEAVLDHGSLPDAIYASGSYPSILYPIKIDNMILTDGGIVNNFPITHIKDKEIDIIIGSNVQDDLQTRKGLKSFPNILQQIITFSSKKRARQEGKLTDVLIKPEVKSFNFSDFNKQEALIQTGVKEARKYIPTLKKIVNQQQAYSKEEKYKIKKSGFHITDIEVFGNKRCSKNYILGQMRLKLDKTISSYDINKAIDNLYGTENFQLIKYMLENHDYGQRLILTVEESDKNLFLKFGFHYDNTFRTGVLLNTTLRNILTKNSTILADLVLGDRIRYKLEYYLDRGWKPGFGFKTFFINMPFQQNEVLGMETTNLNFNYLEYNTEIYTHMIIGKQLGIFLGAEYKFLNIFTRNLKTNGNNFKIQNNGFLSLYGSIDLDTYNRDLFPTSGVKFDGEFKFITNSTEMKASEFGQIAIIKSRFEGALPFSDRLSIHLGGYFGSFIGSGDLPPGFEFSLGGYFKQEVNNFEEFYGYKPREIIGNNVIKLDLGVQYQLFKNHYISIYGNIANATHKIKNLFTKTPYQGIGLGYGIRTLFGPIQLLYSYSPSKRESEVYFGFGFWF